MDIREVSVIGAGAWGSALALHISKNGVKVTLWAYEKEVVDEINQKNMNSAFLPGFDFSAGIKATVDIAEACKNRMIFFVVPSHVVEGVLARMLPNLNIDSIIVSATKGIENEKLRLPSQILEERLPAAAAQKLVCLAGPSFAKEVAAGLPTAITAASKDKESAVAVQQLLSGERMRVYTHDDVMGVELGGAIKNVISIAAGISDGMGLGLNARAAIITRGVAEMKRLGKKMGAAETTFSGLSGVGDLILTATGDLSRNRTVGKRLGAGEKIEEITSGMKAVAEGVLTSRSIFKLSKDLGVDLPVCREVYLVCHEGKNPKDAVKTLMARELKDEFHG